MEQNNILDSLSEFMDLLSEELRTNLMRNMKVCHFQKNEIIYHEGDIPKEFMCLVSGKVKIYKDGIGHSQIIRVLSPVEYFGYRAAFAEQAFLTAAAAFEPSVVVMFPLDLVEECIHGNTQVAWFLIHRLAKDLGHSDERIVNLTQKHVRARLAESLLYLKENYGVEPDGCTLNIQLSREDMANLSNMTTSNAIRTLRNFASENIISIDGRSIRIEDEVELKKISSIG